MPVHLKYRPLVIWRQLTGLQSTPFRRENLAYNQENVKISKEISKNLHSPKEDFHKFCIYHNIQWWHATEKVILNKIFNKSGKILKKKRKKVVILSVYKNRAT